MDVFGDMGAPWFRKLHRSSLQGLAALFGAIVAWQGAIYCIKNGMQTAPATGMKMIWVYGAIPVGGLLLLIVSLVKIYDVFDPPAVSDTGRKAVL